MLSLDKIKKAVTALRQKDQVEIYYLFCSSLLTEIKFYYMIMECDLIEQFI